MKIRINDAIQETDSESLSYEDVIAKAGYEPGRIVSIIWTKLTSEGRVNGMLSPGMSVTVAEGMMFGAVETSRA